MRAGDRAVDLARGSGALALRFARQVRWVCGVDLTPAMAAGSTPGDRRHQKVRRLLEESLADDAAWFHPRLVPTSESGEKRELVIENTMLFIAGEKTGP